MIKCITCIPHLNKCTTVLHVAVPVLDPAIHHWHFSWVLSDQNSNPWPSPHYRRRERCAVAVGTIDSVVDEIIEAAPYASFEMECHAWSFFRITTDSTMKLMTWKKQKNHTTLIPSWGQEDNSIYSTPGENIYSLPPSSFASTPRFGSSSSSFPNTYSRQSYRRNGSARRSSSPASLFQK